MNSQKEDTLICVVVGALILFCYALGGCATKPFPVAPVPTIDQANGGGYIPDDNQTFVVTNLES